MQGSLRCLLTVRAWRCRCRVRWHWVCLGSRAAGVFADPSQRIPEPANAIPESLSKFRQLPRAEDEQGNHQDENQVCWLEQAFHFGNLHSEFENTKTEWAGLSGSRRGSRLKGFACSCNPVHSILLARSGYRSHPPHACCDLVGQRLFSTGATNDLVHISLRPSSPWRQPVRPLLQGSLKRLH